MSGLRDIRSNTRSTNSIAPAVIASTTNGDGVDIRDADSVMAVLTTGAIVGAGDFTLSLEESDDNAAFSAVAAIDLVGASSVPATLLASSSYRVGYIGNKRYVRAVLTQNGGTSIAAAAVMVASHLHRAPDDQTFDS